MELQNKKLEMLKLRQEEGIVNLEKEKTNGNVLEQQVHALNATETALRQQLASHAERFEQFQHSLGLSNDTFSLFKTRIEKLTSEIRHLEKENAALALKKSQCQTSITELRSDIESLNGEIGVVQKQCDKLSGLVSVLDKEIENKNRELLEKENRLNLRDASST
jgi:chromosome segregation ATPase